MQFGIDFWVLGLLMNAFSVLFVGLSHKIQGVWSLLQSFIALFLHYHIPYIQILCQYFWIFVVYDALNGCQMLIFFEVFWYFLHEERMVLEVFYGLLELFLRYPAMNISILFGHLEIIHC